jgi:hypothetical protein
MRKNNVLMGVVLLLLVYVASYAIAYRFRSKAANLAYFVYLENGKPALLEESIYLGFYPIYKIHVGLGGQRNNVDRPAYANAESG